MEKYIAPEAPAAAEPVDEEEGSAFKGMVIALPVSILLWLLFIIWLWSVTH